MRSAILVGAVIQVQNVMIHRVCFVMFDQWEIDVDGMAAPYTEGFKGWVRRRISPALFHFVRLTGTGYLVSLLFLACLASGIIRSHQHLSVFVHYHQQLLDGLFQPSSHSLVILEST